MFTLATELTAAEASDALGFLILAGMVVGIVGVIVQDEAERARRYVGRFVASVGLLMILGGGIGVCLPQNAPDAAPQQQQQQQQQY
ncbi:hypothetical protein [Cryobacterium sp. Y29]|uniref:hypothetical protein n=1 Tax=Cryobacterium sp. Y29 TaxID=2048285 RepID=UPI0011B00F9B|nr:hypothetical protein [Cryobacterium sp. Y29]